MQRRCVYSIWAGFWHLLRLSAHFNQSKNVTIALAVLSIYAVDFAINIGEHIDAFIWTTLTSFSPSLLSQLDRRHIADSIATSWFSMGYDPTSVHEAKS